jgi:hypothetical protein
MKRRRILALLWPLAIWAVVFGWRAVACKGKPEAAGSSKRKVPTIVYHYPPPPPTITIGPGVTTLPLEPQ